MLQKISTANPYIHQIRQSLSHTKPVAVDWLVLAHNDKQLLTQLDEAFLDSLLAVIALPPSRLQVQDERLTELVEWAVAELNVKGVLLVGHSQGEGPEAQVTLLGGRAKTLRLNSGESSSNSLLERLTKAQQQAVRVQEQLAEQIDWLSRLTVIEQERIQLHGLFYRAESGIFYAYDQSQRSFKPLLSEAAAA